MSLVVRLSALLCVVIACLPSLAEAQQPPGKIAGKSVAAPASGTRASSKERAAMTRQFVNRWGVYVQRVYGVPVKTWANRMGPSFGRADGDNFRNALNRDTFEGAMAELSGNGDALSDEQAISKLAATRGKATPKVLGALTNDLVYTPLQPCRIVDTRNTAAGQIAANSTRNFVAIAASSFTSQGGSSTNCGTNPLSATAVAINVTSVLPEAASYTTVYPYGTTQPVAASLNSPAGSIVNNALIAQIPNPVASFDFTIYSFARSHYVVDIVGYFAPPIATALQCVNTANAIVNVAAGATANATAAACAAGYTQTATNCQTSSWQMPLVFQDGGVCSAQNNSATAAELRASRTCCRVPGR